MTPIKTRRPNTLTRRTEGMVVERVKKGAVWIAGDKIISLCRVASELEL